MKKSKGKKSDIKNQKKKSLVRYTTHWTKNPKGNNECYIVEKPNAIPSAIDAPLKESTKALKMGFPTSYEDVKIPEDMRIKAEVIPITGRPKLHSVTSDDDVTRQLAEIQSRINATERDEEGAFIGPPKPELTAANDTPKVEAIRKAIPDNVHELVPKYGSIIKDTGEGMTPSGLPISDFLDGGKYPPKKAVLHGVTSDDYTHEELLELYDLQQIEIMELKTHYEQRINNYKELLTAHEKDAYASEDQRRVAEFTSASKGYETEDDLRYQLNRSAAYIKELQQDLAISQRSEGKASDTEAIIELQEENSYLTVDNQKQSEIIDDMRSEMDTLMYVIDQSNKHYAGDKRSKATLNTLANQYYIYAGQHKDDPLRNFFRRSNYCISQLGALRKHFDDECNHRVAMSNERGVHRKWAGGKEFKKLGRSVHVRNEVHAIKSIGINAAVLRPVEEGKWYCKKVTQCNIDKGAASLHDPRLRPLTSGIDHSTYCKVWDELTYVMTRSEFDDWCKQQAREKLYNEVSKTPLFKVVKPLVNAKRAVSKVLNYELSSKKRKEAKRIADLEARKANEQASSIKRMREEQFDNDLGKEVIRRRQLGLPDNV